MQEKKKKHEENGKTDSPEYQEIVMTFYGKHPTMAGGSPDVLCEHEAGPNRLQHDVSIQRFKN
jgi:hypothetical protein